MIKGYLTIFGSILLMIVLGSVYTWSNINAYYISYLKFNNSPNITLVDGFFLMPIIVYISDIAMFFGPILVEKYSFKKVILLSIILTIFSHFILLLTTRLFIVYFAMVIFGVANGLSYISLPKNCWNYFPEKKGLLSGLILFGYGISSLIFTWVCESTVNKSFVKTNEEGYFSEEIANKMNKFIKKLNVIFIILCGIGYFTIFDYDTENKKLNNHSINNNNIDRRNYHELNHTNKTSNDKMKYILLDVFNNRKIYQMIGMSFFTLYFLYMITNTNRSFGQINNLDENFLSFLSKTYSIINGISRIVWGILFDYFPFKKLMYYLLSLEIFISFTVYYIGEYKYLYFIYIIVSGVLFAGIIVIVMPLYNKIYGEKYSSKIYGIAMGIYGFSCLLGPIVSKVVIKEKEDYKYVYFSGTLFSIISLINVMKFDLKEFKYNSDLDELEKNSYDSNNQNEQNEEFIEKL